MPQLIVKNAGQPVDKFSLARLRTTIGRSARSDVCIPDAFASRLHAEVVHEGDGYWLHDLGSANGTKFNGTPVKDRFPLHNGGEIQIGETRLTFEEAAASPSRSGISATFIADTTTTL